MTDREIINKLGGAMVVSKFFDEFSYTQVHNWLTRGIPSKVKVEYPEYFMPKKLNEIKKLEVKQTA